VSIGYSLSLSTIVPKSVLFESLTAFGYQVATANIKETPRGVEIDQLNDTLGVTMHLGEPGEYPYNTWDSIFFEDGFSIKSELLFRVDEEKYRSLAPVTNKFVFDLAIFVTRQARCNALLTMDRFAELFLIAPEEIVLNGSLEIWSHEEFGSAIQAQSYRVYTSSPPQYNQRDRRIDFSRANKQIGRTGRRSPRGYAWHHQEDGMSLVLVEEGIHTAFPHLGGYSKHLLK